MALQNSNQYTIEKPTDQLITEHEQTTSTNTTSAATTAAEVKDNEQVKPVSPASEQTSSESDEQSEEDQPTMDDIGEGEHSADVWDGGSSNTESNDNGTDDFFEDNKELLKKIKNILDFVYPNSKISLAELLTSVKGYVIKYAQNLGGGGDNDDANPKLPPEGDDVTAPIEPGADGETVKPSEEDKINELIAKGFCKIYNTSLDEFSKVVNAELFGNDIYGFECKKSDDQKEIANAVNIDRYNAEFDKQDNVRIDQLFKAVNAIVDELKNNMPNDQYNAKTIIAPIANYCQNNDTVVLNYISYLLKVFYDKWLLPDGSGDRFPYVIATRYYILTNGQYKEKYGSQDIKSSFENYSTKDTSEIGKKPSEEVYKKTKDGYEEVSIKYASWSDNYRFYKEIVFNMIEEVKKTFAVPDNKYDHQLYLKGDCASTKGKGAIELLQAISEKLYVDFYQKIKNNDYASLKRYAKKDSILQNKENAKTNMYKELESEYKTRYPQKEYDFNEFLHDFGVGVDCSGYVSRAIAFIMTNLMIDYDTQKATLNLDANGLGLRTNTGHLESEKGGSKLLFTPSSTKFDNIFNSEIIQPGDIMRNGEHIRIVYAVDNERKAFSGHQSTSELRKGVKEDVITSESEYKNYLPKGYTIKRPLAFYDKDKLKEYFVNMLLETGKIYESIPNSV